MTNENDVTEADRAAAAELGDAVFCHPDIVALAFARHRTQAVEAERAEIETLRARIEVLEKAGRYIMPYLDYTIGNESPGHHPTMPSAVAEFRATLKGNAHEQG